MKKTITSLALAFCIGSLSSQTVADFETFTLSTNSFYQDTTNAPFVTANASFEYKWDHTYHVWTGGFSYTNVRDSSTGTFSNLYGVRAYKGYNGSDKYIVGQDGGQIRLTGQNNSVSGFYVTNTTLAWKVMKTGNQFAKKFGGTTGNDPDYFGIIVKGYLNGHLKTDTVNFYLADFRFTNNTQDYILDTWQFMNTSLLGAVDSIRFYIFSSDVGQFGINTPLFFAIDNFATDHIITSGISQHSAKLNVSAFPNPFNASLTVVLNDNSDHGHVLISDVAGKTIYSEALTQKETVITTELLQPGIYFMSLEANGQRSVKKIIKN